MNYLSLSPPHPFFTILPSWIIQELDRDLTYTMVNKKTRTSRIIMSLLTEHTPLCQALG